ncbi:hypothetical protein L7F22_025807 [Adiantum nelumboides]|nr:hypothetical protein [Adiantum nelumboides]
MISSFATFVVELVAFRVGANLAKSLAYDPHMGGHHHAAEHGNPPRGSMARTNDESASDDAPKETATKDKDSSDLEAVAQLDKDEQGLSAAASQILGVGVLEFGVIFHSVIIGITLGTTQDEFKILFIVIIFHQMFEGLGLGSRLALLPLAPGSKIPFIGAIAYALVTPIGMAIGLGVRNTYNGDSATAAYVTGIFDAFSAGILLYTGFVELLAHEFIFNEKMRTAPLAKVLLNVVEMLAGAGIMALLGRWA